MTTPDHKALTWIPTVRHTLAELEAAEREIVAAYVALYGHPPGVVFVREAARKLLSEREG